MFLRVVLIFALAIIAVLFFAATRPDTILVQRSVVIHAAPDKIFPLLDDFHNWPLWASQDKEDPTMTRTYSGSASGAGAISDWTSKGSAGRGEMTITASEPGGRIHVKVDFVKPFALRNTHEITFDAAPEGTRVIWSASMQTPYMMKLMGIFMNMDSFIGKHFQASLDNLKSVAER